MLSLLLLRHAKSSWDDPTLDDHERPLNERGKRAAKRMGELLRELPLLPELIVSSDAVRALKTAKRVRRELPKKVPLLVEPRLYEARPAMIRAVLREQESVARVLLVGHNGGLEDFVAELTEQRVRLPTAALAVIDLGLDRWGQLDDARVGRLRCVFRPRELEAADEQGLAAQLESTPSADGERSDEALNNGAGSADPGAAPKPDDSGSRDE